MSTSSDDASFVSDILMSITPDIVFQADGVTVSRITENMWQIDTDDNDDALAKAFGYLAKKRLVPEHFDKWWADKYTDDRVRITILTRTVADEE